MSAWLDIIGLTERGVASLPAHMVAIVDRAEIVIGPKRLLPDGDDTQKISPWATPLSKMIDQVSAARGQKTVVLATGDPNWFGIGVTLARHLEPHEFALHPAPSAFQLAAAHLHWPLQHIATLSLHGRPVEALHPHLLPGNRILALTSNAETLAAVCALLQKRGYGQSDLTLLENIGGAAERVWRGKAGEIDAQKVGDFYTLAIDCVADPTTPVLPAVPGLPDSAFETDGQLTKREVRAVTLAKLAPFPGAWLWDVGAGCGAVAIEWMRAARDTKAICFENRPDRGEMIRRNAHALGVPDLDMVLGDAPETLTGQPSPDAIFIGGDVGNEALFETCWQALTTGGVLVANAVTLEGEQALYARQSELGGELVRIETSVLDTIGAYRALRPRMAVTQWHIRKGQPE